MNGYSIRRKRAAKSCLNLKESAAAVRCRARHAQTACFQDFLIPVGPSIIVPVSKSRTSSVFRRVLLGLPVAAALLVGSCARERSVRNGSDDPVLQDRNERDQAFKSNPDSPLRAEDKARFEGLDYYPINAALRFRLKLNRYPAPERVRMATNTGEFREGLKYGYFEFAVDGQTCRLQAYRMEDESPGHAYLFIPFRDATSGKETYAAGRYLDLPENTSGFYDLDFNRAYNPFCAYGRDFSCPTPPDENRLSVPITAGEKKYPLARS